MKPSFFRDSPGTGPDQSEVGVDPDVGAARIDLPGEAAADHGEAFLVLGPDQIEQSLAAITAGLPVSPDQCHRAGIVGGQLEGDGGQLGDSRRVGPVLDGEQVAGVMPRGSGQRRGPAGGGSRIGEAGDVVSYATPG